MFFNQTQICQLCEETAPSFPSRNIRMPQGKTLIYEGALTKQFTATWTWKEKTVIHDWVLSYMIEHSLNIHSHINTHKLQPSQLHNKTVLRCLQNTVWCRNNRYFLNQFSVLGTEWQGCSLIATVSHAIACIRICGHVKDPVINISEFGGLWKR